MTSCIVSCTYYGSHKRRLETCFVIELLCKDISTCLLIRHRDHSVVTKYLLILHFAVKKSFTNPQHLSNGVMKVYSHLHVELYLFVQVDAVPARNVATTVAHFDIPVITLLSTVIFKLYIYLCYTQSIHKP